MNKHDSHYRALKIEPWEIMKANCTPEEFQGFLKGNILKYLLRNKEGLKDYEKLVNCAEELVKNVRENLELTKVEAKKSQNFFVTSSTGEIWLKSRSDDKRSLGCTKLPLKCLTSSEWENVKVNSDVVFSDDNKVFTLGKFKKYTRYTNNFPFLVAKGNFTNVYKYCYLVDVDEINMMRGSEQIKAYQALEREEVEIN